MNKLLVQLNDIQSLIKSSFSFFKELETPGVRFTAENLAYQGEPDAFYFGAVSYGHLSHDSWVKALVFGDVQIAPVLESKDPLNEEL